MEEKKQPAWLRAFEIGFGITCVVLAVLVLLSDEIAVKVLIVLLSFALLFIGIRGVSTGLSSKIHSKKLRGFYAGIGGVNLVLAGVVLLFPTLALISLIFLLGITLIIIGSSAVLIGISHKGTKLQRGISIGLGALTVGISIPILVYPDLAIFTLVIFLSVGFLLNGIDIIMSGIIGHRRNYPLPSKI